MQPLEFLTSQRELVEGKSPKLVSSGSINHILLTLVQFDSIDASDA